MIDSKAQKKVIGLCLMNLLSDDLSSDQYTELIESLCNTLIENNPEIKAVLIEKHALTYVDNQPDYNQEEVMNVLIDCIMSRRIEQIAKNLPNDMSEHFNKLFEMLARDENVTQH